MKVILALAACAALLAGCDFLDDAFNEADDAIDDILEPPPPPVLFSGLILTKSPLPGDEDGSAPDLYVEIQDAGGRPIYQAPSVLEDADASAFPYTLEGGGEFVGTTRTYSLVVLDRDLDGYDLIAATRPFSADDLRASPSDTFAVANGQGSLRAEILLTR